MNNALKKFLSTLAISIFLITNSCSTYAQEQFLIYQDRQEKIVSSGLIHESIKKFTSTGWVNINVLRVDLSDKYTNIKPLYDKDGVIEKDTIKSMVVNSGAIAGINADYFYTDHFSTPIGPIIDDNKFVSSPNNSAKQFPVFFMDDNKIPSIDFLQWNMKVIPQDKEPLTVYSINKDSNTFEGIVMFDKNWSNKTIGNRYFPNTTEVVIKNDTVISVQTGHAPLDMPENGYVLAGRNFAGEQLLQNFKVGDNVKLQINASKDLNEISSAVGGGAVLVKAGKIADNFTIDIKGNQPRTALGITEDKKQLIIAVVDGRHTSYKGLTQTEMADLMIHLGAYEAINFDGGGSTTMVLSSLDKDTPVVVNYPSDGSQRRVINGVGIFNDAPQKSLSKIEIICDNTDIFVDTSREFFVKGYDRYNNPVPVDQDSVKYYIEDTKGSLKKNIFTPHEVGTGTIIAKYKNKKAEIEINVLNSVKEIQSDQYYYSVDVDSEIVLADLLKNVYGLNDEGYSSKINVEDIQWDVFGDIGSVKDGVLYTSKTPNSGVLTANIGDAVKNFKFSVGYVMKMLEDFENTNGLSFTSYPAVVQGNIKTSSKSKDSTHSLKLEYDFTNSEDTQAAYIELKNGGIKLENKADKLGLWVYGNQKNHWLRAEIYDSKGNLHRLNLANDVDWKYWKWVTADIPSYISYPITVKRIYLVETNPLNMDKGYILVDGLKSLYHTPYSYETKAPEETMIKDVKEKLLDITDDGYKAIITTGVDKLDTLLDYQIANNLNKALNTSNINIVLNNLPDSFAKLNSEATLNPKTGFSGYSKGSAMFIQLNDLNGGIRQANPYQWTEFLTTLQNTDQDNIIISLPKPVFGDNGFSDSMEAELFHRVLLDYKKDKNIWVVQTGSSNKTQFKDGIRYIYMNDKYSADNVFDMKYLTFTVKNKEVTYSFQNLFDN